MTVVRSDDVQTLPQSTKKEKRFLESLTHTMITEQHKITHQICKKHQIMNEQ